MHSMPPSMVGCGGLFSLSIAANVDYRSIESRFNVGNRSANRIATESLSSCLFSRTFVAKWQVYEPFITHQMLLVFAWDCLQLSVKLFI